MENTNIKVLIEYISGQSFYKNQEAEMSFGFSNEEIIARSVSEILAQPNFPDTDVCYLECKNKELNLQIIQETMKRNPNIKFVSKKLLPGGDFGENIFVSFPKEPTIEELKQKRNQLSRRISSLKKVALNN